MNFKKAISWLKEGKKVRRPSWEENSCWVLGIDQKICWKDGETAHIHINQIEAADWELFKEKPKVIILDDNELSIMNYAEEFPKNWKRICDALDKKNLENLNEKRKTT